MRLFIFFAIFFSSFHVIGQCSATVASSNGYTVTVNIDLVSIVAPATCPWGYNYNVNLDYNIVFGGTNIPSNLYTLQGNVSCGGVNTFYNLPNSGGVGSTTTTGNQYTNATDCATATPASLNCYTLTLQIGGPGLSNQTVNMNCTTLPVELLVFEAYQYGEVVELEWETASETNNDYFTLSHSLNGIDWIDIGEVEGSGNSVVPITYGFTHLYPVAGLSYYRLQQVDYNGDNEYFPIASVNYSRFKPGDQLVLYPNPTALNSINVEGFFEAIEEVKILNVLNQDVSANVFIQRIDASKVELELTNLSKGIYFVKTKDQILKFIRL